MVFKKASLALACTAAVSASVITPHLAHATNPYTVTGNNSSACSPEFSNIVWDAETRMNMSLEDYSNSGYIKSIAPKFADPGIMEITHFYLNPETVNGKHTSKDNTVQVWRIPIASDNLIKDARITVTVPAPAVTVTPGKTQPPTGKTINAYMQAWGDDFKKYTWQDTDLDPITDNGDGSWTLPLGDILPGSGRIFQLNVTLPAGTDLDQDYIATAQLVGTQGSGKDFSGKPCGLPEVPVPTPSELNACQVEYIGRSVWNKYDADITERNKYFASGTSVTVTDEYGETNNDGWGRPTNIGADAFNQNGTRTVRLYAGTHKELINAEWSVDITQGAEFTGTAQSYGVIANNRWILPGFTQATNVPATLPLEGITHADISQFTMAKDSWFAYNVGLKLKDQATTPIVMVSRLKGTLAGCDPAEQPAPKIDYTEWSKDTATCTDTSVTLKRTKTTTPFIFDEATKSWVPDASKAVTSEETNQRSLTATEALKCASPLLPLVPLVVGATAIAHGSSNGGSSNTQTATVAPKPAPHSHNKAEKKRLADTGANILGIAIVALMLALAGVLLLRRRRG